MIHHRSRRRLAPQLLERSLGCTSVSLRIFVLKKHTKASKQLSILIKTDCDGVFVRILHNLLIDIQVIMHYGTVFEVALREVLGGLMPLVTVFSLTHDIRKLTFTILEQLSRQCNLLFLELFDLLIVAIYLSQQFLLSKLILDIQNLHFLHNLLARAVFLHLKSFHIFHAVVRPRVL